MPRASSTKSESGTRGESSTPITSGRATSSVQSTGSVQSGVSFDPQDRVPCGGVIANATVAPLSTKMASSSGDSASHSTNEQFTALRAGEEKRLAEHIPGPQRVTVIEDELEIALCVEDEAVLEVALQADIEESVEMSFGKIEDLSPPPSN